MVFEGFVFSEILKAQWAKGEEGEVYYFRDEQGLEVDFVVPSGESGVRLVECKSSATVTPDMSVPMRKVAKAFEAEGLKVSRQLVYNPKKGGGYRAPTVGVGVEAVAINDLC